MQSSYTSNIMDALASEPDFSTFVSAIKAAGLDNTLRGAGPYTVFAPNNDAFNKLPQTTLQDMLKPQNKAQLVQLVNNHVLQGKYTSQDLIARAGQAQGGQPGGQPGNQPGNQPLANPQSGRGNQPQGNPSLGGANPQGGQSATQSRGSQSQSSTQSRGTGSQGGGMGQGGVGQGGMQQLKTLAGTPLKLTTRGNNLMIGNSRVTQADVQASNGIIHVIDMVMLPQAAGGAPTP
jgi:uncharacterized surface protein with fasciclin (FAS1) repeats